MTSVCFILFLLLEDITITKLGNYMISLNYKIRKSKTISLRRNFLQCQGQEIYEVTVINIHLKCDLLWDYMIMSFGLDKLSH